MSPTSYQAALSRDMDLCFKWCLGRDLNPHVHRGHGILSPVRLPIPPPRHNHLKRLFFSSARFGISRGQEEVYRIYNFSSTLFSLFFKVFFHHFDKRSQTHIFHSFQTLFQKKFFYPSLFFLLIFVKTFYFFHVFFHYIL